MTEQEKIKEIGWAEAAIDTLRHRGFDSEADGMQSILDKLKRVTERAERMKVALDTIAGGHIDRYPDAPDPMTDTSVKFMTVSRLQAIMQKLEELGHGDLTLHVATLGTGWLGLVNVTLESTPEGYDYIDLMCINEGVTIP